jgi:hypothetical protein
LHRTAGYNAQIDHVRGGVNLVHAQAIGQRLQLAAAGGKAEVAAFLGKGLGRAAGTRGGSGTSGTVIWNATDGWWMPSHFGQWLGFMRSI